MPPLSLVSNLSRFDRARLERIVPHWLRVLGPGVTEVVLVLDPEIPTGRIAGLHAAPEPAEVLAGRVEAMARADPRVRLVPLQSVDPAATLAAWFRPPTTARCQGGTPILAFVAAVDAARHDLVLRLDCDMVFSGSDWLEPTVARVQAGEWDLASPPRLGERAVEVSSRGFLLDRARWRRQLLPLTPARLDPLRTLHRWMQGRPRWRALENTLEEERRRGRLRHGAVERAVGASLHVARASEAAAPDFPRVLDRLERGEVPAGQRAAGWNYAPAAWAESGAAA